MRASGIGQVSCTLADERVLAGPGEGRNDPTLTCARNARQDGCQGLLRCLAPHPRYRLQVDPPTPALTPWKARIAGR